MGNTRKVPQRGASREVDLPYANFPRQSAAPAPPAAAGAHVYTFDADGNTVLEGRTETGGRFRFLRDQLLIGRNNTGSSIAAGTFVRITGWDATASVLTIAPADVGADSTMPAVGITSGAIANNASGRVWQMGLVSGLNTNGMTVGGEIYLTTAGGFTQTKPTAAGARLQELGTVVVADSTVGQMHVNISGGYQTIPAASSGSFDPRTSMRVFDDFVSGTITSGGMGELGWGSTNGTNNVTTVSGRPGILQRITAATANSVASVHLKHTSTTLAFLGSDLFDVTWSFRTTATNNTLGIRAGVSDGATSSPPANGLYAEKLPADTAFFGVSRAASAETRATSTVTHVANQWHRVRVRRISSTQVGITVDNAAEVTSTTTLPTLAVVPFIHFYQTTTTTHTLEIDWFDMTITGLSR